MSKITLTLKHSIALDTSIDWVKQLINDQLAGEGLEVETASEAELHDAVREVLEEDMGQLIDFDSLTSDDWTIQIEGAPVAEPHAAEEPSTKSEGQG